MTSASTFRCGAKSKLAEWLNKNGVKKGFLHSAYDSTLSLQQDLYELAEQGNSKIENIRNIQRTD